jgi:hypothetical protein
MDSLLCSLLFFFVLKLTITKLFPYQNISWNYPIKENQNNLYSQITCIAGEVADLSVSRWGILIYTRHLFSSNNNRTCTTYYIAPWDRILHISKLK